MFFQAPSCFAPSGSWSVDCFQRDWRRRWDRAYLVGLATVTEHDGDDMRVTIGLDVEGRAAEVRRTAFRGGDAGRRRAANLALAELWRRLRD